MEREKGGKGRGKREILREREGWVNREERELERETVRERERIHLVKLNLSIQYTLYSVLCLFLT